ncbi:MAG TPA: DolP-mannose mannosyltransferase [Blastocatellia bacterium]|nr:DolP-mannose mannosyltransferase [Blastocatellia bacterium]
MSKPVAIAYASGWRSNIMERTQSLDSRALFFITVVVAAISFLPYQFWKQPSVVDHANWDYFAQVIARGGVPYRDVVNIKSPLSAYIAAGGIILAHPFGLRDIFAIRVVYLLLMALTVGFTFLVASIYFKSRRVALMAAAIMMAFNVFGEANCGGVQPKTPMILFGLISLWAIQKDKPFLVGLVGMLSALSWQPGLLFVGVAILAFSRYTTSWRDLKAIKAVAGAAVPLTIFLGYFWLKGVLPDVYWWNIDYNLTVDAPRGLRTVPDIIDRFYRLLTRPFRSEAIYFLMSGLGFALACRRELKASLNESRRRLLENASRHAVIIAPSVYFGFCLINIQGGPDMIPLLPFVAIFGALGIVWLLDRFGDLLLRRNAHLERTTVDASAYGVVLALILILSVGDSLLIRVPFPTLRDQDAEVAEIVSHLQPGDEIYAHGRSEILVLSGLTNADRHFFLDRGKDVYLDRVEPGGFAGWLERLKAKHPKIVAIDRTKYVERKDDFEDWMREDYEERRGRIFTYYLRRMSGQQ